MKTQLDKQDEQLEYVVARLNHMREGSCGKRNEDILAKIGIVNSTRKSING